ncbi:MAG: MFS transporter [Pseudomonadota bacterium]
MLNLNAEWRFSIYYAALFASIGSVGPFFAVWLDSLGIEAGTIGVIAAAPSIVMVFTTVAIGRWADGLKEKRTAIILCNVLITLAQLVLFWPVHPWLILISWTISGVLMFAKVPVTDAAALSVTSRRNTDFARVRVYGSIGFVVAISASGYLYDVVGIAMFIPVLFAGNVLRLWLSAMLPREQTDHADVQHGALVDSKAVYQKAVLLSIVGAALIQSSHAVVYTFGILLWNQQGYSETTGSLLIAIGVVAEVLLMWRFESLTRKLSARGCLIIAATLGVFRWAVLATSPSLPVIYLAQLLHGATFGLTYLATALFIARRVGEANAARGQGLSATVTTAFLAVATYSAGQMFDTLGMLLYWVMAGICALAMVLLVLSFRTP